MRARAEGAGRALSRAGWRPSTDITTIWQGFTSLGDAASRRAFLATTRAVIDPGGQTVSAHDYLPDAAPIPTLIIRSREPQMMSVGIELFEGAGHFPHLDEPDRFADLVRDFIATT